MQLFEERGLVSDVPALSVRIVDGSTVSSPGGKAVDYRLHTTFDLSEMRMVDFELTNDRQGESLLRHSICPEEVVLADRGYGKRPQIAYVLSKGAHVIVRIHMQSMPLETKGGKPIDTLALLETLREDEIGDWSVYMRWKGKVYPMRLVAVNKESRGSGEVDQATQTQHTKAQAKEGRPALVSGRMVHLCADRRACLENYGKGCAGALPVTVAN